MTANKHPEVRAAIAWRPDIAHLAREHNNANVLCLPARYLAISDALDCVAISSIPSSKEAAMPAASTRFLLMIRFSCLSSCSPWPANERTDVEPHRVRRAMVEDHTPGTVLHILAADSMEGRETKTGPAHGGGVHRGPLQDRWPEEVSRSYFKRSRSRCPSSRADS